MWSISHTNPCESFYYRNNKNDGINIILEAGNTDRSAVNEK